MMRNWYIRLFWNFWLYPEFSLAYTRAKQMQKDLLVQGGLLGVYDSKFSIFVAQNFTDMRERKEITGADGGPIILEVGPIAIPRVAGTGGEIEE